MMLKLECIDPCDMSSQGALWTRHDNIVCVERDERFYAGTSTTLTLRSPSLKWGEHVWVRESVEQVLETIALAERKP